MRHPGELDLALLAGDDVGFVRSYLLERHVSNCERCRVLVARFRQLRADMAESTDDFAAPDLSWNLVAGEMRANIRLGLEAGECVRPPTIAGRILNPRLAVALASLFLIVAAGFFFRDMRVRARQSGRDVQITIRDSAPVGTPTLQSTPAGVELRTGSNSLTLLNPRGAAAQQTVSAEGEIRAGYVNGDTGSVTINNVYLQ